MRGRREEWRNERWVVKIEGNPDLEVKGNILDHEYTSVKVVIR
jgi:hypothetical protein